MGVKSRTNWNIKYCTKSPDCINWPNGCDDCIRFSKYEEDMFEVQEGNKRDEMPADRV